MLVILYAAALWANARNIFNGRHLTISCAEKSAMCGPNILHHLLWHTRPAPVICKVRRSLIRCLGASGPEMSMYGNQPAQKRTSCRRSSLKKCGAPFPRLHIFHLSVNPTGVSAISYCEIHYLLVLNEKHSFNTDPWDVSLWSLAHDIFV